MERLHRDRWIVEGAPDLIQDQIILAPEIMSLILEQLDLRSLKRVRLVCKSWLREAGTHMEKKGQVRFNSRTLQEFRDTFPKQVPGLSQPCFWTEFNSCYPGDRHLLFNRLSSQCPPLKITRLYVEKVSLDLAAALITKSCSTLEFLSLLVRTCTRGFVFQLDRSLEFPKLRHLKVDKNNNEFRNYRNESFNKIMPGVVRIVAWITRRSPNLETYESYGSLDGKLCQELLLKVDIRSVKTLALDHGPVAGAVEERLLAIPFTRLEKLSMCLFPSGFSNALEIEKVLIATIAKCTATLRTLDLRNNEAALKGFLLEFRPVCPQLQELTLEGFPEMIHCLSICFPSLQVLNVESSCVDVNVDSWRRLTPFIGLKTLRAGDLTLGEPYMDYESGRYLEEYFYVETLKFLEKFPALECMRMSPKFALHCYELKAGGDPRMSKLLDGIKHLELRGYDDEDDDDDDDLYGPLTVLQGVERITIAYNKNVLILPYLELRALKVLEFPWFWDGYDCPMDELLEMARRVDKLVVTNCCSIRRSKDAAAKRNLNLFFNSALNAMCGCKK